jgi:hypothetical protein
VTHAHRPDVPDPGRDEATRLLIAHFDDARHRRGGRRREDMLPGPRECLGCGSICVNRPGYQCYGGGPLLYAFCAEPGCNAHAFEYRIPWDRFYRLVAPTHAGQLGLFA